MKFTILLCLVVAMSGTSFGLRTKYILFTGSGFEPQTGLLSLSINSTSNPEIIVDMMPENDDVTPITEYIVDETDSPITTESITGASVKWTPAQATNTVSISVSIVKIVPVGSPPDGRHSQTRSFCISDQLQPNRVYQMSQC